MLVLVPAGTTLVPAGTSCASTRLAPVLGYIPSYTVDSLMCNLEIECYHITRRGGRVRVKDIGEWRGMNVRNFENRQANCRLAGKDDA